MAGEQQQQQMAVVQMSMEDLNSMRKQRLMDMVMVSEPVSLSVCH